MGLEEAVEGVTRAETKQAAQLGLRELTTHVFFERERFERAARQVTAGGLEPLRHVIGDVDGHLHGAKRSGGRVWGSRKYMIGVGRITPSAKLIRPTGCVF